MARLMLLQVKLNTPYKKPESLQTIISAGEACNKELIEKWGREIQFINAYGPTESTVCATMTECNPDDGQITIGKPIANTQVYVLSSHLKPVPVGVVGELYIGGVGLARGYLDENLTNQRFVSNPLLNDGTRIYKTGDMVRWLPDGNLEFLGRNDDQIKIRGFRIELGEIKSILSQYPKIRQCTVIARNHSGDNYLAAYYESEEELNNEEQSL